MMNTLERIYEELRATKEKLAKVERRLEQHECNKFIHSSGGEYYDP